MSEASFAVTYTFVYINYESGRVFWGADEELSDGGYDVDDEDEDEEKEEEHLALADFAVVIPIDELVSPLERTEPTITPPSTNTTTIGATITIRPQTSISLPPEQDDIPESEQPPRKRLCLATLGSMYEVGESSIRGRGVDYGFTDTVEAEMRHRGIREVGYGIRDPWIDPEEAVPDMASTTLEKDGRTCISQRVAIDSQQVNLLMGDRMTLQETVWIMEEEAYAACEAWAQLVGLNQTAHHELQTLREQYTVDHPIFDAHNDFLKSQNELSISQNTIMEQMTQLTSMCEMLCQIVQKKQEEKQIKEEQVASARYWKIPACCDDDDDYDSAITPILSTEEPIDSLSILDTMCDVHLDKNHTPLEAKDHVEIVINSNDDISSSDDDSLHEENIEYVEASPHDSEVVSLEVAEIVTQEVEEIEDDNLREKLLNVYLLIVNIEALKDNPTQSFEFLTKSSSTSLNSFLEETNTFHNSLPEFENFYLI
nr:hypothetical protein [Tanacetum cinerariifolium]